MKKVNNTLAALALAAACVPAAASVWADAGQDTNNPAAQNTNSSTTQNSNDSTTRNSNNSGMRDDNSGTRKSGDMMKSGDRMMAVNSTDRKFMEMAAMGGMAEVEAARVALDKSSSDAVKQYAQKMIDDHTKANQELMQLASAKGVTLPAGPDAKHRAMLAKMSAMSGADFDREYVKNSGVKDHEKMLKLVQGHSRKGGDPEVRAFAAKMVGPVGMHLDMARQMMNAMTGMKGGGAASGNMKM